MPASSKGAESVLSDIGELDCVEAVAPFWDDSKNSFPGAQLPFLDRQRVSENSDWCGFEPSIGPLLSTAAGRIAADPNLSLLAWHCHQTTFKHGQNPSLGKWPSLEHAMGKDLCGGFYLLVALDMAQETRRVHAGWGIPEQVTRDTCRQVFSFCHTYELANGGRRGVPRNQIGWLRNYMNGDRYFRLGRLEFRLKSHASDLTIFRRGRTSDVLVLKEALPYLTKSSFLSDDPVVENPAQNPTPAPARVGTGVSFDGYPIAPFGYGLDRRVALSPEEWRPVFSPGDMTLEVHIPAGGGMSPEACRHSFFRAAEFFPKHFPSEQPIAYRCYSWILNTQFEDLLPPDSNLVRFMRELYLFPVQSKGNEGADRIFAMDSFDPKTSPRRTTLQRAVAGFLEKGGRLRQGGMFFLMEDLPHYGTQFYRRTWNPRNWRGVEGMAPAK